MATTREELDRFHQFAVEHLTTEGPGCELDELVATWYDSLQRDAINEVLRASLADIDAGLGRPAREVTEELRVKYRLTGE